MTREEDARRETNEQRLERAKQRDFDSAALVRAQSDAQFVLQRTLETFSELSDKAFRLIRMNGLVITVLIAAASQVNVPTYTNTLTVGSVILFIGSVFFAVLAYMTQTVDGGVNVGAFRKLATYRLKEVEYLHWILTNGYPEWIENGVEKGNRKERWIRSSLIAFLAGFTMLISGMLLTIY